jgi:hypothetical protein
MGFAIIKGECAQHAITIKPVTKWLITDFLSSRTITKKSTFEVRWYFSFDFCQSVTVFLFEVLQAAVTGGCLIGPLGLNTHVLSPFFV